MQLWALLWHIRTLSDQPIAVSGVGLARFLPILVFSLLSGLVADRYNRRQIMFVTQSIMLLTALLLGLLTWLGQIQLWQIYALTAIQAVAISFDMPARHALVPNLLPRHDLPSAFSMTSLAFNLGSIVGPALSGLVISYRGQFAVYLINATTYLAVLLALAMMGKVAQQPSGSQTRRLLDISALSEGIRFIVRHPIILSSMLLDFLATFFSSANTLLPFVAVDILKVGAVEYGWLSAAQSIGAVTVALVISQRAGLSRQGKLLMGAVLVYGLATALFGASRFYILAMLALVLIGASDALSTILRNTIRQLQTPDNLRGRMVSVNQIFALGGPQLGEIEAGLVAQVFSIPLAMISGGIGCILGLLLVARRWPQLGAYNGDEPVLAGSPAG